MPSTDSSPAHRPSSPEKPHRWVRVSLGLLAVLLLVMAGATALFHEEAHDFSARLEPLTGDDPFYAIPSPVPAGQPGEIVRSEPLAGAPDGASAWRVLYHSRDVHDTDILVSGIIVAPSGPAPAGGRTIVAWGHPTTGAAPQCAPSREDDPFTLMEGLHDLLAAGYVVAATDYAGMGVVTPDSYLVGKTEGQNMLDAARAARHIEDAGAGERLVLWGHSQGGQAALFAAELAPAYTPELTLLAVAVAAPASDLGALFDADVIDVSGVTIGAYAFDAYAKVYAATPGVRLDTILTEDGVAATSRIVPRCLLTETGEIHAIATPVVGRFLKADPATTEPWSGLLDQNTPGSVALTVPLLVVQGKADTLVRPEITAAFVEHERAIGTRVTFIAYPDIDHGLIAMVAMPDVMKWLREMGA
ncbi:MAG: alpha/beta fold hydrolase [Thermomicrobiales bacterium]